MSWDQVAIGEVADIVSGATPKSSVVDYWGGDVAWATPTDLSKLKGKHLARTERTITRKGLSSCAARVLPANSVLFTSRAPIGLVAINTEPMATNQGFKSFVPFDELDASFLFWWLKANRQRLEDLGTGATFKEVSKRVVSEVQIPLPPIDEQRRIAAILDKADAIRRKREQALDLTDEFLKSVFSELFGAGLSLKDGDSYHTVQSLLDNGAIKSIQDGNHGEIHPKVKDFSQSGIPFVTANMLRNGRVETRGAHHLTDEWMKKLRIGFSRPGDVLLSHKGSIGFSAIVDDETPDLILSPQVTYYRVNPDILLPEYLNAFFRSGSFQSKLEQFSKQSTRAYIGITRQKSLQIFVPRLGDQKIFSRIYNKIESIKLRLESDQTEANQLFASLSQRAFRGEL